MASRSHWLADKVLLSAIGLVLGTGLLVAGLLAYQREQAQDSGEKLSKAFAAVIDEQTVRNLQSIGQHLDLVSQSLASVQAENKARPGERSSLLQAQVEALPFIDSVMVLDARGNVAYASRSAPLDVAYGDKDFTTIYKTRPSTRLYVAAPMRDADGRWLLPVARPLTAERNGFAGILVAMIKVSYFDELWASLALDTGSSIALLRSDGQMLLRSPIDDTAMGRSFADLPLFLQFLPASANGSFRITSPLDGVDRFTAYRTLRQYPDLLVVFGRTMDAILGPWYQLAKLITGMWLLASLALLALAIRLARQSVRRERAENTSAALAQRLNVACEAAGLVLWDWDLRSDQWHVTPTYYTTLGYPAQPGPVSRAHWQELLHPDDRGLPQMMASFAATQKDARFHHQVRMRHADESYRWFRMIGQAKERDHKGHATRMIGIRMDVTERVNAERERREMVERISDALVTISADWTITHVNERAGKLLGHSPAAMIGRNVWTVFPDSGGHQFRPVYERCMASQRPEIFEEYFQPADVWYESHIYPSPDGLSIYFRDITQRKRDEEALRRAKEQAENLINGANVMVVGLDAAGQITIFNKAAQEMTGYALADLAGRNWFEILVPIARYPEVHAAFDWRFGSSIPMQFENPILTASGEERQIAWQNSVLRDGDRITGTLSFGIDVTSRRQAERALIESKEQFETLARHSLQGIVLIRKAQLIYVNPAICAIAGRSAAELSRVTITQVREWVHPDDRALSRAREQRRQDGIQAAEPHELRILDGKGQWRWIQVAVRNIMLSGSPTQLVMALDIHDRHMAEDALRASEERFRRAFDSSGIGMGLTALDGQWMQVNPSLCRIVGYSAEEMCQRTFMQMTHPDDLDADQQNMHDLLAGQIRDFTMEKRYLHRDGHPVWVNLTVALVRDDKGTPLHTVAQIEDIDRRKQLEQELRESQANLKATIEALPDLMFELDLEGTYHDCHTPHSDLLVLPVADLVGRRVADVMPATAARTTMAALHEANANGYSMGQQIALELAGGTHWFELSITRKDVGNGNGPRFIVLSRQVTDRIKTLNALRSSEELLRQMAESVSQVFFLADLHERRFLYISSAAEAVLGCLPAQLYADPAAWRQGLHPEDRNNVAKSVLAAGSDGHCDLQFRMVDTHGAVRWVHARSFPVRDAQGLPYRSAGVVEDITPRKTLEIREEQEHAILQYLASERPMPDILEKFVIGYETMFPGMRGSILLMDADGLHLRHGAAPHLPQSYCDAIDGVAIGPAAGSCGTAAFTGTSVMVEDIANDPRWNNYHALALAHGLGACWSVPIKNIDGQVLGTFAFYFDHPRAPSQAEVQAIEHGAQLASQALQRHFAVWALQHGV